MGARNLSPFILGIYLFAVIGQVHANEVAKLPTQNRLLLRALVKKFRGIPSALLDCTETLSTKNSYEAFLENPDLVSFLGRKKNQLTLNRQNALAFQNEPEDFACVAVKSYGFCGGMTSLTKHMAYFGFFDPENLAHLTIPNFTQEPEAWRKFYVDRLEKIADGTPEFLPGFRNLHELSADPVLGPEVKRIATEKWAEDALSISGVSIFLRPRRQMETAEIATEIAKLQGRVERHEMPRILFSAFAPRPAGGVRIHSVSIWKVDSLKDGSYRLWTWETNSGATPNEIARNFISVRSDGQMYYEPWYLDHKLKQPVIDPKAGYVARIVMLKEDLSEMPKIALMLKNFFSENPILDVMYP